MSLRPKYFQTGKTYKINSVFDGSVLDLRGNKTAMGTEIITYSWSGAKNQLWIAAGESVGYRLSTAKPNSEHYMPVLDGTAKQAVVIWSFHGRKNQQWLTKEVRSNPEAVLIRCLDNGLCIRNMGCGKPVKLVPATEDDKSCMWTLSLV